MNTPFQPQPDFKWGTAEGSREFDRLQDRSLSFRQKLEWLEEMETLTLRMQAAHAAQNKPSEGDKV